MRFSRPTERKCTLLVPRRTRALSHHPSNSPLKKSMSTNTDAKEDRCLGSPGKPIASLDEKQALGEMLITQHSLFNHGHARLEGSVLSQTIFP